MRFAKKGLKKSCKYFGLNAHFHKFYPIVSRGLDDHRAHVLIDTTFFLRLAMKVNVFIGKNDEEKRPKLKGKVEFTKSNEKTSNLLNYWSDNCTDHIKQLILF
jgi:hypothetical protein